MSRIRILLVDPHQTVRDGLQSLLDTQADMHVVGKTGNAQSALTLAESMKPSLILLDSSSPEFTGAAWVMHLRALCPQSKLLILSAREDRRMARLLLAAGAAGFLVKSVASSELISAIHSVIHGESVLPAARVPAASNPPRTADIASSHPDLSEREVAIVRLIAQGCSNRDIADQLGLSVKEVETCKHLAMQKLQLDSRIDFIRYAHSRGLLENR